MTLKLRCELVLPQWTETFLAGWQDPLDSSANRMKLAVALSAENVRQDTGGPFGAVVVELGSNRLLGVGVNLVTRAELSMAHAEMVAIAMAQSALGSWNLGARKQVELVTSCEPCAMCFGAVPWSGINSLVWGAGREDAEAAGFDEGDKPADWPQTLNRRGIKTTGSVMRREAAAVLARYGHEDGHIYHPEKT